MSLSNFMFNGVRKDYLMILKGKKLPTWAPIQREITEVPGRPGGVLVRSKTNVRTLTVPIRVVTTTQPNLQLLKEDLANWLITEEAEELIFDDEPNRTYFAVVDNELDLDELITKGRGTITFICPDAYKYGPVQTATINSPMTVANKGTAEAFPLFKIDVKKDITSVDIMKNEEEYLSVGEPDDVDKTKYKHVTKLLDEKMDTPSGWRSTTISVDNGAITGSITSTGDEFYVTNFGTGTAWHGPALLKSFSPAEDYIIRVHFNSYQERSTERGRSEVYFLAADGTVMGKLGVRHGSSSMKGSVYIVLRNGTASKNIVYREQAYMGRFYGYIELKKKGNVFYSKVVREKYITYSNPKKKVRKESYVFRDTTNRFDLTLAGVIPHIAAYSTNPPADRARIRRIIVERINPKSGDVPFSFEQGDSIEIDHQAGLITVNEIDRMDLKDFGANFFKLDPGDNALIIEPIDSISGTIEWRDRYK